MKYELQTATVSRQPRYVTTLHLMVAFILFGIALTCGMLFWYTTVSPKFHAPFLPLLVLGLSCLLSSIFIAALSFRGKAWLQHNRNNRILRLLEILLLAVGSLTFLYFHWKAPATLFAVLAAVVVFAVFWEQKGAVNNTVVVDDEGIKLPGRLNPNRAWQDVDKVMLRHGTLTIEFEENKIWQQTVRQPVFNANEMEAWCATQIETHRSKRAKSW